MVHCNCQSWVGYCSDVADGVICHRFCVTGRICMRSKESIGIVVANEATTGLPLRQQKRIGIVISGNLATQAILSCQKIILRVVGERTGIVVWVLHTKQVMPAIVG